MKQQPPIFFLHPPKCGGTSVISFFAINAGKDAYASVDMNEAGQGWTIDRLGLAGLAGGHRPYGIHRQIKTPLRYVTALRDPLARQISHYWYARAAKNGAKASFSLNESLALAGEVSLDEWVSHSLDGGNLFVHIFSGGRTPNRDALDLAIDNIKRRLLVAGRCEDLSEFLLLLCARTNLNLPFYISTNVTDTRGIQKARVSDAASEKFKRDNALDYELYNVVADFISEEVREYGDLFRTAMDCVRSVQIRLNALENPMQFLTMVHGFSEDYLDLVRQEIKRCDLGPINEFLAFARSRPAKTEDLYDGAVEEVSSELIRGWATNLSNPESPVQLEIVRDDRIVATVVANQLREDIQRADYPGTRTGFSVQLPLELRKGSFSVRVAGSREPLQNGGTWTFGWYRS